MNPMHWLRRLSLRRSLLGAAALSAGLVLTLILCFSMTGSADNTVRLVGMEPRGEVGTETNLVFIFSDDVVPKSRVGQEYVTDQVQFRPQIPGKVRWETTRRLQYLPEVILKPSTVYSVDLKETLGSELKKTLIGNRHLEFTTERFRVTESSLDFVYNPDERRSGLVLKARLCFNYGVSAAALQRSLVLCLADNRQPLQYTIEMYNDGREVMITSAVIYRGKSTRRVELSLPQGFLCVGGAVGLKERYAKTAELREMRALKVNDISTISEDGEGSVVVHFSEPVDPETAVRFISTKPAVQFKAGGSGDALSIYGGGFKPGKTYEIRVAKGLPSLNGNPLEREFNESVAFPDLEPSVGFDSPGRYLSSKGNLNLGLETVNVPRVEVEVARIFPNNLVRFIDSIEESGRCYSYQLEKLGRVVSRRVIPASAAENEVVTTPLHLGELLSGQPRGIYQLSVCDPDNRWIETAKVVIVTDLGILAKMGRDDLVVWVNSLENLAPKPGARVSLFSYDNQEIASGETNEQGIARLSGLREPLKDFRSYVIQVQLGEDISFVCLGDSLIDTTDFEVEGRPTLMDGYEAFLYADRGVFRPGDTAHVTAVVRGPQASMPAEFPLRLEVVGPDGMVFREYNGTTGTGGICTFSIDFPGYARTGEYTASARVADQSIGVVGLNVEEFMPERIKVTAVADKEKYSRGDTAAITVTGVNLFGPPAAGRRAEMAVQIEAAPFSPPAYRSYVFGEPVESFAEIHEPLGWTALDSTGKAAFTYHFPETLTPPSLLRAVFQATVTEDGGRSVSSYATVEYHARPAYVGLRHSGDRYAKVGESYPIQLVVVDPAGQLVPKSMVDAEVYSVTWNSIYRRDSMGQYTYQSERQEELIAKQSITLAGGQGTFAYRPAEWGCFKVVFIDRGSGARSTTEFYAAGWGYQPWSMDHPDRIQLDLDKEVYRPGDQATLQIKAPFAGRALVTVERERVFDSFVVDMKENSGSITIPIKNEYKPNAYVSVHLIRLTRNLDKRAPTRAFGTIPLTVDCSDSRLNVTISTAREVRPQQDIEVSVATTGSGDNAWLTLAAVDEGICQISDFQSPDPWAYFYGKRALGLRTYDLYGMLLPELDPAGLPKTPGGGMEGEPVRQRNLNPVAIRRVKPVSLWSGLIRLENGRAQVKLSIPQFNGTLRLMAVAVSGSKFGSATGEVLVRDAIVMTPTFPRFAAPGDRFVIPVSVFNGTGRDGEFQVKLQASGPVTIDGDAVKTLTLANKGEKMVRFAAVASKTAGVCRFALETRGNGAHTSDSAELAIRPAEPVSTRTLAGTITPGKPVELTLPASYLPGTAQYSLCLAGLPSIRFAGSIRYLLGYPYGCIEQTTSRLFPLLYFGELVKATQPESAYGGKAERYIAEGIEKIQSMQLRDGGFSFWPGSSSGSAWGSVYAAHFLVEARKAGYSVPDRVFDRMAAYLDKLGRKNASSGEALQLRVYALYVLSLAAKPQLSSMAYIKAQRLGDLYSDSRALLAAAYYYAGDKKTAREMLPNTFAAYTLQRQSGGNFNSTARTDAIILGALADINPSHPAVPGLLERLSGSVQASRWGTTQENAFGFMAIGKILSRKEPASFTGDVLVDGKPIASFDSKNIKRIADPVLGRGKVTVRTSGAGECYYYAEAGGVPLTPSAEADSGIVVRRSILDQRGRGVDLARVKQGDLLVVRIAVKTSEDNVRNVAVVDMLPAGLEIENPRLATAARIDWISEDAFAPEYIDIRDDRLLLFASFGKAGMRYFYYSVRAVSCGTFTLPPIKAECMYQPQVFSLSSGGTIQVVP